MKILATYSHQTRMHNFGNFKEHEFYIPPSEAKWNSTAEEDYRQCYPNEEIPDNLHYDELIDDPDIVLGKGGDVNILHDLNTEYDPYTVNIYQTETQLVMNPPKNKNWLLILHGVDTERFNNWKGGDLIVTLFNGIFKRRTTKDQTKYYAKKIKEEFGDRFKLYGVYNEDGYIPHGKVHKTLQEAGIFLHIRTRGFAPFNVAEALCTGCPVIAAPNPTVTDDIIPGYNGEVTKEICETIKELSQDRKWKKALSENARRFGKQRFNLKNNLARWDFAFRWARAMKEDKS